MTPKRTDFRMILNGGMKNSPNAFEFKITGLLCEFFRSDIEFIEVAGSPTPDLYVLRSNQLWEIKELDGHRKNTVHHAISRAKKQSLNIVLAAHRTKLHTGQLVGRIKAELAARPDLRRIILVTKDSKILVIKGKIC